MAVIGITINEVIRDFIGQLAYTYNKYKSEFDLKKTPVNEWDLLKYFKFGNIHELNNFLYFEASLEIFGHADQLHNNVIAKYNEFSQDIIDNEKHKLVLISRETSKSIPATLFFLSKLGFSGNNLKFVTDYKKKWDEIDVLITANPIALENKPKNKISVKVNASYNTKNKSDLNIDSITQLFDDDKIMSNIENKIKEI